MATVVEYIINLKDNLSKGLNNTQSAVDRLDKSVFKLNDTVKQLGVAFGAMEALNLAKGIGNLAMENERTRVTFGVLMGSTENAKKALADLYDFAKKTPFQINEVLDASKQMLSYGFTQKQLIPEMKKIGDVASGLKIPFGDIAYLYGTLKAQGRAYAIDIRQFAMRGIPIYDELAKVMKTNVSNVKNLVEAGKIGFPEVSKAFENMTSKGGKFNDLMYTISGTAEGQLSNMKDNFTLAGIALGNEFLPNIKALIAKGIELGNWVKNNTSQIKKWIDILGEGAKILITYKLVMMSIVGVMKAKIAVTKALQLATLMFGRTTAVATAEVTALNTVMKANVWGVILTGVTLAVAKFIKWNESINKIRESTNVLLDTFRSYDEVISIYKSIQEQYKQFGNLTEGMKSNLLVDINKEIGALPDIIAKANIDLINQKKILEKYFTNAGRMELYGGKVAMDKVLEDQIKTQENIKLAKKQIEVLMALLAKYKTQSNQLGIAGVKLPTQLADTKITATPSDDLTQTVTAAAPKVFNINITKLVESLNFTSDKVDTATGREDIKQKLTDILTEALVDVQSLARA